MAQPKFDYQGALDAGYSEAEINNFLQQLPTSKKSPQQESFSVTGEQQKAPIEQPTGPQAQADQVNQNLFKQIKNFDVEGALKAGYSPDEINEFLSSYKPERTGLEKAGRLGAQYALGAAEMALLPYEIGVLPLALPGGQEAMGDLFTRELLSEVYPTEEEGKAPPRAELKEPINIGIRGLTEKVTGLNLHPEGILEKAASWTGFIKNPSNVKELAKIGLKPKELFKAITPSFAETARGLSAGTALQMAEEGNFGPLGTIAAAITGDLIGHGPKALLHVAKQPKKSLAQATSFFKGKDKQDLIRDIISDADKAGLKLDAGTITNSPIIQFIQARAAQSGLTGTSLENFRKELSSEIIGKYSAITDELGMLAFENNHQAAESVRQFVSQEERRLFPQPFTKEEMRGARPLAGRIATETRPDYQQQLLSRIAPEEFRNSYEAGETLKTVAEDIKTPLKEQFNERWSNLNRQIEEIPAGPQAQLSRILETFIEDHQGSLLLGESTAESRVLQSAMRLRNSLATEEGALIGVSLRNLIKTKRTLGDIANWEFGGSNFQSAYKQIVGEIDRAIEQSLERVNPQLREAYEQLNAEYSMFKDVFENKNVMPLFEPKNQNYNTIYNGFLKNPDKLRSLEDMMFQSPRGQQLINQVKRDYAQRVIESPGLTARDLSNLENVLGPQFEAPILEFIAGRQRQTEHPLPRAARQPPLGARVEIAEARPGKSLAGRGVPKAEHARRKLFEYIRNKSSDQIMKQMDTPEGIQRLRRALSLTAEGEELFNKLARFKLHEMIDKQMMDNLGENLRFGTFSGLLKSSKSAAIVKELVGPEAYAQLRLLQKHAGRLQDSMQKFYNASKSGTTLIDAGIAGAGVTGILTGNPYLALPQVAKGGGMYVAARLLSDAKFLGYLKEAVLENKKEKFNKILLSMLPSINRAMAKATLESREER